jgi:hypothetical protein
VRASVLVATIALAALGGGACGRGGKHGRAADSAVWIDGAAVPLSVSDVARFEAGGIAEVFVDAARVEWRASQPQLTPRPLPKTPRRVRATLVVRGAWPTGIGDAEAAAKALATSLGAVARNAEEAGLAVSGWHLDFVGLPGKDGGELAQELRDALEPNLLLSATLPTDALASEGLDDVIGATDFVVSFLYGNREGEAEDPATGDFKQIEQAARKLEELEEPFLVGVVVRGAANVLRNGQDAGEIPGATLEALAWNRKLRIRHGFSLEGIDRQVYAFTVDSPTRIADTRVYPGDNVRVVCTSTAHMQEMRRLIASWKLEHHLGQLYYRLPHVGDGLTLTADSLARIGAEEPALPDPRIIVTKLGESPGRVIVKLTLHNASSEASDLAQVDSNLVELWAVGGAFGDVRPGGFYRYDVYVAGSDGKLVRTIRYPTVLRLFAPLLPAGGTIETGPIEVRTVRSGLADLQVRATFMSPYGGSAEIKPTSWMQLQPAPTPTPTPQPKPERRR